MKVADSVMIAGVLDGVVLTASTLYQIDLSHGANALEAQFSYAFMSPDPMHSRYSLCREIFSRGFNTLVDKRLKPLRLSVILR